MPKRNYPAFTGPAPLTKEEIQQDFEAYGIVEKVEREQPPSSPPKPNTKTPQSRSKLKRKSSFDIEQQTSPDGPPAKKAKQASPPTPSRRSERQEQRRRASASIFEQEKSKKTGARLVTSHHNTPALTEGSASAVAGKNKDTLNQMKSSRSAPSLPPMATTIDPNTGRFVSINKQMRHEKKIPTKHTSSSESAAMPTYKGKGKRKADAGEDSGDDDVFVTNTPNTSSRNGTFKGTSTNKGHSAEKPPDAPNDVTWQCANRDCNSGQTWYNREGGDQPMGRKSISQFFGRNKKETKTMDLNVWHNFCRKDYQRAKYNADKKGAKSVAEWQIDQVEHQLLRMYLWRPEATFNIQLSKVMTARAAYWHTAMRRNNDDVAAATDAYNQKYPKKTSKKVKTEATGEKQETPPTPEEAFPPHLVEDFEQQCCRNDVSYEDAIAVINHIKSMLADDEIQSMPPVEFLISDVKNGETINDTTQNYDQWCDVVEMAIARNVSPFTIVMGDDEDDTEGAAAGSEQDDEALSDVSYDERPRRKKPAMAVMHDDDVADSGPRSDDETVEEETAAETGRDRTASTNLFAAVKKASDSSSYITSSEGEDEPKTPPSSELQLFANTKERTQPTSSAFSAKPGSSKRQRDDEEDDAAGTSAKKHLFAH